MIKSKKQMFIVIGAFALVMLLGTVTYAFFNYTRTGSANIIKTGRINFNSEQGTAINLTNLFPIDPEETGIMNDVTKVGTVTINVTGDTTYGDGIEYLVSAVNVTNSVGNKSLPISISVSVENNTGNNPATSLGNLDADYFTNRGSSAGTSIYKVLATDAINEGDQLVVGYIKSGSDGVDGNIVIKAYIDKEKVAISDTYPEEVVRTVNENFDGTACSAVLTGVANASTYCASSSALQEAIDNEDLEDAQISALVSSGMVTEYTNGTSASFGEGRTVLTTSEWNGLQTNGVSFQVKVEANEGIWVEAPAGAPTMAEMCPDCVFAYSTTGFWTMWNTNSQTPSVLTSSDYSTNYEDVITASGKNYFLGLKLNGSNQIEKAYACGLYNGTMPFCIEGYSDGTKYEANKTILQDAGFWNNTCSVETYDEGTEYEYEETYCAPPTTGMVDALADSDGYVRAGVVDDDFCGVNANGYVYCYDAA